MEGTALPVTDRAVRPRRAYLDNLKVVLVVGVIVGHVLITYADVGTWSYRETSENDAFLIPSALVVALGSLFAMGVFFLIAGLLTPGPAGAQGTRRASCATGHCGSASRSWCSCSCSTRR